MRIDAAMLRRLIELATAGDEEVCGVLLGHRDPPAVARLVPGRNVDPAPRDRYVLDAATLLHADRLARSSGLAIAGFFHSHPRGAGIPSHADRETMWPGYVYLIAARSGTTPYICAWVLRAQVLVAEPIEPMELQMDAHGQE